MRAIPVVILLAITWLKAAFEFKQITDSDPGLFEAFGYHILQGKILYADFWDHKPPLVFFLNFLFLKIFGISEDAISLGSMLLCMTQTLVFYAILLRIFRNKWISVLACTLFIITFFNGAVFGSGNYTEQYGVLCTTAGFYYLLGFIENKNIRYLWISGVLYGLSCWFKEPFLFSAIPIFIYLFIRGVAIKYNFHYFIKFGLAFLIPALLISNFLALTGSWDGFKEHLVHSSNYLIYQQKTGWYFRMRFNIDGFIGMLPFSRYVFIPVYLCGITLLIMKEKTRIPGILILGTQIADYVATGMSGNQFFHYYLQSLPLTCIVLLAAPVFLGELLFKEKKWVKFIPMGIAFVLVSLSEKPWNKMTFDFTKKANDPIVEFLKNNEYYRPRSIVLGSKEIGFYLLRAEGISNQRYIVPYPYHWTPMKGKPRYYRMSKDSANFMDDLPEYVIHSDKWAEMFRDCGLDSLVRLHYNEVASAEIKPGVTSHLLKKKIPVE